MVRELVKWKDRGMKNGQFIFDENIAKHGVIPIVIQTRAQIFHQLLFQRMTRQMVTLNQMVVFLIDTTGWTVWTLTRISAVKDVANREDTVSPLTKKLGRQKLWLHTKA